jgi:excisionase family DNA binding protein
MSTTTTTNVTTGETLLTVDQVAQRLQLKPISVRRAVWSGVLPASRIGRLIRIRPADLESYIDRTPAAADRTA